MSLFRSQLPTIIGDPVNDIFTGCTLRITSFPGTYSIARDDRFVTAEPSGQLSFEARKCQEWECFVLISETDLRSFQFILRHAWLVKPDDDFVHHSQVGFGSAFQLHFGEKKIYLPSVLPLKKLAGSSEITLAAADETPILRAERVVEGRSSLRPPIIWIEPLGNAGNRALQYLACEGIRAHASEALIENIILPEWGMHKSAPMPNYRSILRTGRDNFWIDTKGLASSLRRNVVDAVIIDSFAFNLGHYPKRSVCRSLLGPTVHGNDATGFGPQDLVCSVRAGEILAAVHPDYVVLPAKYYELLAERSNLNLVFYGQLGDDSYSQSLRSAFPTARFVPGRNPQYDFDMLRRSVNIAPSISTFAWLAAWLSDAQKIFMPFGGMFSPVQHPGQMYLPIDDSAYEFVLLPFSKAVSLANDPQGFWAQQKLIGEHSRFISREEVRTICERAGSFRCQGPLLGAFDSSLYLEKNRGLGPEIFDNGLTAIQHFYSIGHRRKLEPMHINSKRYLEAYPDAAIMVAEGRVETALQHFLSIGYWNGNSSTA
jgi:hypothetical protein